MTSQANRRKISLGIVGFGNMGERHWKALEKSPHFNVTLLADPDVEKLPRRSGLRHLSDYREVKADMAEAILVAAPSALHAEAGLYFLDLGLPIFMEKPLALSLADCRRLAKAAESSGVGTMVGMVERFNPAFVAFGDLWRRFGVRPRRIVVERFNPSSAISDSDVVLDLLVHDLDLLLWLLGDGVVGIRVCDVREGVYGYDYVSLVLDFASGFEVEIRAGRGEGCGEARRYWECEWADGSCGVDLLRRRLDYFSHLGEDYGGDLGSDALLAEHDLFADIVGGGVSDLGFNDNLAVMELLFRIYEEIK